MRNICASRRSSSTGSGYTDLHYESALAKLRLAARWLSGISPDAAASLREGVEETPSVVRLGRRLVPRVL